MAEIAIEKVRSFAALNLLSGIDKCHFIQHNVYGKYDSGTPNYYNNLADLIVLEKFLWNHRSVLAKDYVLKLSGRISSRVYSQFSDSKDNNEIALTFYFSLIQCDQKDRVDALAETICEKLEREDYEREQNT